MIANKNILFLHHPLVFVLHYSHSLLKKALDNHNYDHTVLFNIIQNLTTKSDILRNRQCFSVIVPSFEPSLNKFLPHQFPCHRYQHIHYWSQMCYNLLHKKASFHF